MTPNLDVRPRNTRKLVKGPARHRRGDERSEPTWGWGSEGLRKTPQKTPGRGAGTAPRRNTARLFAALVAAGALGAIAVSSAHAYDPFLHEQFPVVAFEDRSDALAQPVAVATLPDLAAFRAAFYEAASTRLSPELSARFRARYPTSEGFDSYRLKELLGLNPAKDVWSFDRVPPPGSVTVLHALQDGSRFPESDLRAADRFYRDEAREPVLAPDGSPLPFDPMTLRMGGLTGLGSMGHAHYALPKGPLSDDPAVLKKDPRHFAIPPDVKTWGADFVQTYLDLALLAHASGLSGTPWLSRVFEGTAFLHLTDICNQIHTVQVGLYDFFFDAKLESWKEQALSLFGLRWKPEPFEKIGIRILASHHTLSEALFARRMKELLNGTAPPAPGLGSAELAGAWRALATAPPELERTLDDSAGAGRSARERASGPFAMELAQNLVELGSPEGPEVYRLIRAVAIPGLSGRKLKFDKDHDDPDLFIQDTKDPKVAAALRDFYALEVRALVRVGAAMRALDDLYVAESGPEVLEPWDPVVLTRLVQTQLDYLDGAEARRRQYLADRGITPPPAPSTSPASEGPR